jgi:hypothetical protein
MAQRLCDSHSVDTVVLSGGTFQNALLVDRVRARLAPALRVWTNAQVPPNDGGISLGQAALAAAHALNCAADGAARRVKYFKVGRGSLDPAPAGSEDPALHRSGNELWD